MFKKGIFSRIVKKKDVISFASNKKSTTFASRLEKRSNKMTIKKSF